MEMKNEIKIAAVDKKQEPAIPIKRPKKTQDKKLKNGNNRTEKYIKKSASKELNLKKGAVGFEPTIKCIKNKRVILFGYAPKKF